LLATLLCFARFGNAQVTRLKADEQIAFYPGMAERVPGKANLWRTDIRGCVFEVEKRQLLVAAFGEALELKVEKMTAAESAIFAERARLFLVDHERGKKIQVRWGTNEVSAGESGADGWFRQTVDFESVPKKVLQFDAVLGPKETRQFAGEVFLLESEGVSVISDIDDTIKITDVRDRRAMVQNTFLREFEPVRGMAEFYQALARSRHAAFHYISASPWQLYEPLADFVASEGFPPGTFELKQFRWKDRSFFSLFANPEKYKPGVIEPLLKRFPQRKFILIGDSGERDPESYGALARKFPAQIIRIYIRNMTNEAAGAERFVNAFRGMPHERWQVFRDPGEIKIASE
jgi:phosphatidate phosphatase APP1